MLFDSKTATLRKPGRNRSDELPDRAAWKRKSSDMRVPGEFGFVPVGDPCMHLKS